MPYLKRALAASSALLLGMPTASFAHTNSIGYVGNGGGSITFWYGTYHNTNFNEAELKLEGANGTSYTTQIVQFNQLTTTTPTGLDPTVNYFTTDGTQLIPYSNATAAGGQSNTWQGVTFTGLAAGDYTFTYIPLGDAESYNPSGSPTMDWAPWDQVIRSSTVTISAAVLAGSSPTVVSTATVPISSKTVTTITETPSDDGTIQKMTRDVDVDVTVTSATIDTYSDGSTVTTGTSDVTTSTRYSSNTYSGRIDQLKVLDGISRANNSLLNHMPSKTKQKFRIFENNRMMKSYNADGYDGFSTTFGGGFELDLTKGWTIGGQYNDMYTELKGVDSLSHSKREHFGVFNSFHGKNLALITNGGLSKDKYEYARTLEYQSGNWGETQGQQWWVNNRLYLTASKSIQPFIGHTVHNVRRDAYVETGTTSTARSVAAFNQTKHVGDAGLRVTHRFGGKKKDFMGMTLEASYATDSSYEVVGGIDINKFLFVEGSHSSADGVSNNSVAGKVKFRF
jgi:hypothetical protein